MTPTAEIEKRLDLDAVREAQRIQQNDSIPLTKHEKHIRYWSELYFKTESALRTAEQALAEATRENERLREALFECKRLADMQHPKAHIYIDEEVTKALKPKGDPNAN